MLDAAVAELVDIGYEGVTMLGIARRAGASKETLYSWFGSKEGLLRALIEREVSDAAERTRAALGQEGPPDRILVDGARALLRRATTDGSVAIRRAAVTSVALGRFALDLEREQIDAVIEAYMARLTHLGPFLIPDPGTAHRLYRSLITADLELRILLGQELPAENELHARASTGVDRFLALVAAP
ncbi:MAG: TetR/AcrR family transcriptional regulator [Actinomycetota bacterium]